MADDITASPPTSAGKTKALRDVLRDRAGHNPYDTIWPDDEPGWDEFTELVCMVEDEHFPSIIDREVRTRHAAETVLDLLLNEDYRRCVYALLAAIEEDDRLYVNRHLGIEEGTPGDGATPPSPPETGRCVMCFHEGLVKRAENGALICDDSQACVARITEEIRVR